MTGFRSVGGNYFWVVTYIGLILIGGVFAFFYPYHEVIRYLIVPLSGILYGLLFILISKWKNIWNGRFAIFGPVTENLSKRLYKVGYLLIGMSLLFILMSLVIIV